MSSILGFNASHDGAIVLIENGELIFSIEAEKDSQYRHQALPIERALTIVGRLSQIPDVIAVGGWSHFFAGYSGLGNTYISKQKIFGSDVVIFSSSHERSHLMGTYAMSPYEQGRPCYSLIWEGTLGCFYRIDETLNIHRFPDVLAHPGWRYPYLYYLGLAHNETTGFWGRMEMAGKLMALAGVASPVDASDSDKTLIEWILDARFPVEREATIPQYLPSDKSALPVHSDILGKGVENPRFRNLAFHFSNSLFDRFYNFAKAHLREKIPLLISGGCGLNCDWNTRWRNSGLFSDVFVPPCANDSGSAIGTAVDAQFALDGKAKLKWDVYSGEEFIDDCETPLGWEEYDLNLVEVAELILKGAVIAWVQGRCEIGPRALGNRSLLAEPFSKSTTAKLNHIKMRESYRPIAPICLAEDVSLHFDWTGPSPHMLHFQRVIDTSLSAIEHDDGTARVQTVTASQNANMYGLLIAFKRLSGKGVLCNTSLNFKQRGFINRMTDLIRFADQHSLSCCVINNKVIHRLIRVPSET